MRSPLLKTLLLPLIFLSLSFVFPVFGQIDLGTDSKKAAKSYEKGNALLHARDFEGAIKQFNSAAEADPDFFRAHVALIRAYSTLRQFEKTEKHLKEAIRIKPDSKEAYLLYFDYANRQFTRGEYDEAQSLMEKYMKYETQPDRNRYQQVVAKLTVKSCEFAREAIKKPLDFKPEPMSEVLNSYKLQYYPVLSGDQKTIYYTSREGLEPCDDEDLVTSTLGEDGNWSAPEPVEGIAQPSNEGTCTISADGRYMIFTICEDRSRCGWSPKQVIGSCDLFISYRLGDKWSDPQNMGPEVNTPYWESQPTLSADGRSLYFVSNRPGGLGDRTQDIWVSYRMDDNSWSKAENIGAPINTPFDEVAPFMHANGQTLFFASNGHIGLGGFDLYKANFKKNETNFDRPVNLGYPINTHREQAGLFVTPDGKKGLYTDEKIADRRLTDSKLMIFEMPPEITVRRSFYVRGTVYDAKTKKKIDAKIDLFNLENDKKVSSIVSDAETGKYLFMINKGESYALNANKEHYLFKSLSFDMKSDAKGDREIDIYLEPLDKGKAVTLNNIFFSTAKWDLRSNSKTELDILVKFLTNNPDIRIEISGHTDDVGSDTNNQALSEKRARSVVDYLTEKGIDAGRLESKGYGESKPKVPNDSAENRAKNRRIDFQIL